MNRVVNPVLRALLRSPIHGLASRYVALISYTGRRSGREYTIPCFYRDKGDEVRIAAGWPDRKVWGRNLTGGGGRGSAQQSRGTVSRVRLPRLHGLSR